MILVLPSIVICHHICTIFGSYIWSFGVIAGLHRTSASLPFWISKLNVPVLRLLVFISDLCLPSTKAMTKTRTSAMTKRARTRASKFKDGEDVDVLRALGHRDVIQGEKEVKWLKKDVKSSNKAQ